MRATPPLASGAFYPERFDRPEPTADRMFAGLRFHLRRVFARRLRDQGRREAEVRRHASRFLDTALATHLPALRYGLRRDGFGAHAAAECYAWYCAALAARQAPLPAPHVLGAADRLIAGGMVELADPAERLQALGLAASAFAAHGTPVHVIAGSDARARQLAAALEPVFSLLGLGVGGVVEEMPVAARRAAYALPVVCAAHRQIASDYLQDHLKAGGSLRRLGGSIGSLAGHAPGRDALLLRGLGCALVDEADWVMLEDAAAPVMITAEADRSAERLVYDQALEFARALEQDAEFMLGERSVALTPAGAQRLERLLAPLGGVWASRERRRQLIDTALAALHLALSGRDYRVEHQRVIFPEDDVPTDDDLRGMVELKEGCRLSAQRNVLARLAPPRLFRRYLHLAGVCADARGLEREFWTTYSLQTTLAGGRVAAEPLPARVFTSAEGKREALLRRVREAGARNEAILLAMRSARGAQALAAALHQHGLADAATIVVHPAEPRRPPSAQTSALRLVVAELHDSARQLARLREAYAPERCELVLSLEDEALTQVVGGALLRAFGLGARGELSPARAHRLARLALRRMEKARGLARDEMLSREQYLSELLSFSGSRD